MGYGDTKPGRPNALHSLSIAVAGGTLQVLQQQLRERTSQPYRQYQGRERGCGASNVDPIDLTARCEQCHEALPQGAPAHRKFCNKRCQSRYFTELGRAQRIEQKAGRTCETCAAAIDPERRQDTRYCCASCRPAGRLAIQKTCPKCGVRFKPHRRDQLHCCRDCKNAARRDAQIAPCAWCGKPFHRSSHRSRFCSMTCASTSNWRLGKSVPLHLRLLTSHRFDAMWR